MDETSQLILRKCRAGGSSRDFLEYYAACRRSGNRQLICACFRFHPQAECSDCREREVEGFARRVGILSEDSKAASGTCGDEECLFCELCQRHELHTIIYECGRCGDKVCRSCATQCIECEDYFCRRHITTCHCYLRWDLCSRMRIPSQTFGPPGDVIGCYERHVAAGHL
jgi:hypothetical protein